MLRPILLSVGAVSAGLIIVHLVGLRLRPNPIVYFILLFSLSVGLYSVLQRVIPHSKVIPIWGPSVKAGPHVHFEGPDLDQLLDTEFQYPSIKSSQCTEKPNNMILPALIDPPSNAERQQACDQQADPKCVLQPTVIAPIQPLPEFSPATYKYVCSRPQLFSWNREDAELVQSAASFQAT